MWSGSYKVLDQWDVVVYSLRYSLPACVLFTILAIQTRQKIFPVRSIVWLVLVLIGIGWLTYSIVVIYNGSRDEGIMSEYKVLVIDKVSDDERIEYYDIYVPSWLEGRRFEKLSVEKPVYSSITVGRTMMKIQTKPGKLGFEWLVGMEKVSN